MPPSVVQNNYGRLADPGASAGIGQIDLIDASGQLIQSWQIRTPKCTIGSSSECSISISDSTISPLHATLIFGKRHTLLKANAFPTKISGRNIREWLIDDPTEVVVGNSRLIIFPSLSVKAQVVPAQNLVAEASRLSKPSSPTVHSATPLASTSSESQPTHEIGAPAESVAESSTEPSPSNTFVPPVQAYEQFVASTQDTLRDIQTLLGELHQTVDEVRSTVTNDQSASNAVKSVVESVTNEFGSVGQRWFADLSSQFATQQNAQSTLINELSSDINTRFSNIEGQLKAITESASKESTLIAEQLEQARASQQAIEQRFEHLEAQKNELFEALSSLRSEVLSFTTQPPVTRYTQETNPQPDSGLGYYAELDYQRPQPYVSSYADVAPAQPEASPMLSSFADTQDFIDLRGNFPNNQSHSTPPTSKATPTSESSEPNTAEEIASEETPEYGQQYYQPSYTSAYSDHSESHSYQAPGYIQQDYAGPEYDVPGPTADQVVPVAPAYNPSESSHQYQPDNLPIEEHQFGYESPQYGYSAQAAQLRNYRATQDELAPDLIQPIEEQPAPASQSYAGYPPNTSNAPAWPSYDEPALPESIPTHDYSTNLAADTPNAEQLLKNLRSEISSGITQADIDNDLQSRPPTESQLPSWFTGKSNAPEPSIRDRVEQPEFEATLRSEPNREDSDGTGGYFNRAIDDSPEISSDDVDSITDRLQRMLAEANNRKQEPVPESDNKPKRWSELYNVSSEPEQDFRESFATGDAQPSWSSGNESAYREPAIEEPSQEDPRYGASPYESLASGSPLSEGNSDDRLDRFTRNVLTPSTPETASSPQFSSGEEDIASELESEAYASALLRAHSSANEESPSNYQLGRREPISEQFRSPASQTQSNEYREETSRSSAISGNTSDSSSSEEDEESIEEYMQRLLKRVRSGSEPEEPAAPVKTNRERKNTVVEPPAPTAAAGTITRPTQTRAQSTPPSSDFTPRQQAPEQKHDLAALRELANNTARRAIGRSTRRRNSSAVLFKLSVSALAVACATTLLAINGLKLNAPFGGMVASLVVAILWGVDCFKHFVALQAEKVEQMHAESDAEARAANPKPAVAPTQTTAAPAIRAGVASEPKSQSWRPSPMD